MPKHIRKSSISLGGKIAGNYTVELKPGEHISLVEGATFNGKEVGGQVFSNNSTEKATFRFHEFEGDISLVSITPVEQDFLNALTPSTETTSSLLIGVSPSLQEEPVESLGQDVLIIHK